MSFEVALKVPHAQNILLGKRGRDYSIAENLAVLIALKGCWDQKVGEYPRNPVDYFNYKWKKADKGFVAAALAGNTNTKHRLVRKRWWSLAKILWSRFKNWSVLEEKMDIMQFCLDWGKQKRPNLQSPKQIAKTCHDKQLQARLIYEANLVNRGKGSLVQLTHEYNKLVRLEDNKNHLLCHDQNGTTMNRWVNKLGCLRFRQRLKPILSEQNKMKRLKWCLDEVRPAAAADAMKLLPVDHDINVNSLPEKWQKTMDDAIYGTNKMPIRGFVCAGKDEVQIYEDEKWFLQTANGTYVRILADKDGNWVLPGLPRVGSKRHIGKVMVRCACGQPIYGENDMIFDGKVMI